MCCVPSGTNPAFWYLLICMEMRVLGILLLCGYDRGTLILPNFLIFNGSCCLSEAALVHLLCLHKRMGPVWTHKAPQDANCRPIRKKIWKTPKTEGGKRAQNAFRDTRRNLNASIINVLLASAFFSEKKIIFGRGRSYIEYIWYFIYI